MLVLLKLLLFFISTIGSFELIRKVSDDKVSIYFLPSLTIAIQVTVLFPAGLLNLLPEAVYGLYLIGFAGIIYRIIKERSLAFLKAYLNPGYILTFALLLIFAVYLRGKVLVHYDNFSHWGLVVKSMLATNRYPNFQDTVITFQEYPLGSSTYIYYFAKLIKTSESFQMLAQTYMMLAAILPLCSFATKNQLAVSAVVLSFTNYVFGYNIRITDLLVDTLLPLVGICGLLFVFQHCKEDRKIMLWFAACYMVQVSQIKNSGIFFVVFMVIYLLKLAPKRDIHHGMCAAAPFLSLLLWHKHCGYVFLSAATTKHAMTFESFESVFAARTPEGIKTICMSLLRYAVTYKKVWTTAAVCALIGVLILVARKELMKEFRKTAVLSLVIYVTYMIGMLGMYLFSMPGGENGELAAVSRYTKSILIAILYLNMVPAVMLISELSGRKLMTAAAAACVFASFYVVSGSFTTVLQLSYDASERKWIEDACKKYSVAMESSYCILIPSDDAGYASYLGKYIFQTPVKAAVIQNEDDFNEISQKYVFVYDQNNEIIQNWVQKVYPEQVGNEVIIQPVGKTQ